MEPTEQDGQSEPASESPLVDDRVVGMKASHCPETTVKGTMSGGRVHFTRPSMDSQLESVDFWPEAIEKSIKGPTLKSRHWTMSLIPQSGLARRWVKSQQAYTKTGLTTASGHSSQGSVSGPTLIESVHRTCHSQQEAIASSMNMFGYMDNPNL